MTEVQMSVGNVLCQHAADRPPILHGRIVLVRPIDDVVVVSPFPKKDQAGNIRNYFRRPRWRSLTKLREAIQGPEPAYSVSNFELPGHWLLTPEEMESNDDAGATGRTRRDLMKWHNRAEAAYERIRPFVAGRSIEEILLDPDFESWPRKRADQLGLVGVSQVQRDLNAYIFGLGLRGALRPYYSNCGAPGKRKFSKTKTGRPNIGALNLGPEHEGLNCDQAARDAFIRGWKRHLLPGVSKEAAFEATLHDWFAQTVAWKDGERQVKLKPEALKYTIDQFEYWGRQGTAALSAAAIQRGETSAKREYLRRRDSLAGEFSTVNGNAFLDSTSTDVTLVSAASRLKVLTPPWRTDVLGAGLDYIFGMHVGWDSPSNMTTLLALLHAAEDKVDFCARFGIVIEPNDWYAMTFHRVLVDNGDPKGSLVLQQISEMEMGAHYGMAYDAINKSPGESNHQRMHRKVDHRMPGSTYGKRPRRGEAKAADTALLTYHEYMPELIRKVLHHNNVERVPHLLTLAMRNEGVEPTRRSILEWMMAKGYVSSTPADLAALRVRSLPRFRAVIHADGVHIFNPMVSGDSLLPGLTYRSEWLLGSRLLEAASKKARRIDVHFDPMNLREIWVNLDGLRRLEMHTRDPDMLNITMLDWCQIAADDKLADFLARASQTRLAVEDVHRRSATKAQAKKERSAEIERVGKVPKSELLAGRREKTAEEHLAMTGRMPRAKPKPKPEPKPEPKPSAAQANEPQSISPTTTSAGGIPPSPGPSSMTAVLDDLLDELQ